MKKSVSALIRLSIAKVRARKPNASGEYFEAACKAELRRLFMKHHRDCSEMVLDKNGECMAAIYITPTGQHQKRIKEIFKHVQEQTVYACDMPEQE